MSDDDILVALNKWSIDPPIMGVLENYAALKAENARHAATIARQAAQIQALERDVEPLRELLELAKCPDCNGSGRIQIGMEEFEQCQWCYERLTEIDAAPESGEQEAGATAVKSAHRLAPYEHEWEVWPHYDRDCDYLTTDDDQEAWRAAVQALENGWDQLEPGKSATVTIVRRVRPADTNTAG